MEFNNAVDYSERLWISFNDMMRNNQAFDLKDKFLKFNNRFNVAFNIIYTQMLKKMNHRIYILTQEEQNIARIQDSPEMRDRWGYTFGQEKYRRLTIIEIIEKELKKNDKEIPRSQKQFTQSKKLIIDLINSSIVSQQDSDLFTTL